MVMDNFSWIVSIGSAVIFAILIILGIKKEPKNKYWDKCPRCKREYLVHSFEKELQSCAECLAKMSPAKIKGLRKIRNAVYDFIFNNSRYDSILWNSSFPKSGIDPLNVINIVTNIEDQFSIEIKDGAVLKTPNDLLNETIKSIEKRKK